MNPSQQRIGLLCFAGLQRASLEELSQRGISFHVRDSITLRNHDLILVDIERAAVPKLLGLRTVEDLFFPVAEKAPAAAEKDLQRKGKWWNQEQLFAGLHLKNELFPGAKPNKNIGFAVFVKQDRDHALHRKQAAAAIADKLGAFRRWKPRDPADIEVWGFLKDDTLTTCLRLTDNSFRQRSYRSEERSGSLRPTLAAALVALSHTGPGDVFLDPMCGSGTIVAERIGYGPFSHLYGCDLDQEAVRVTQRAVEACLRREKRDNVTIRQCDARRLDLDAGCIDTLVANLPWGKQYNLQGQRPNERLYRQLLTEFDRVVTASGTMVLLTAEASALSRACEQLGLAGEDRLKMKVLGSWAQAMVIKKEASH